MSSPPKTLELVSRFLHIPSDIFTDTFDTEAIHEVFVLKHIAGYIFQRILPSTNIHPSAVAAFLDIVALHYFPNPFHNFQHAVNVLHMTYLFAQETRFSQEARPEEMMGLLVAAVCHDVGHRGKNNQYEVRTQSELAMRYNDLHVLEQYHASLTFELLEESGLASHLREIMDFDYLLFRKTVIACILATDMDDHARWTHAMSDSLSLLETGQCLLHLADLSNAFKPFSVMREWSTRIAFELHLQQVSESFSENNPNVFVADWVHLASREIYFLDKIVRPMLQCVAQAFPSMSRFLPMLDANVAAWTELYQQEERMISQSPLFM